MDKRTILAFALSFAVLLLWSFFAAPPKDNPPPGRPRASVKAPAGTSSAPLPEKASPAPAPAPVGSNQTPEAESRGPLSPVEEKEIRVETPLYKAVFSNVGPTLKSFQLKRYRRENNPRSPLIEMVSVPHEAGPCLSVDFGPRGRNPAGSTAFTTDKDLINLGRGSEPEDLTFKALTKEGLTITKTFRLYPDEYRIDLTVTVENPGGTPLDGNFSAALRALPPGKKKGYYSYVGLVGLVDGSLEKIELDDPGEAKELRGGIRWLAYEDDYFISALIPLPETNGVLAARKSKDGVLQVVHSGPAVTLTPSGRTTAHYALYFGPRDLEQLKKVELDLDRAVNFGWTDIIARPLLYLLRFFYNYTRNYGVAIIILTILIKIIFWPLTHKSYKSMKEMQKLQPRMAKIREKYKGNKEQMNKELMALYKTYKVNPMGGCLPMIIQIPVFFALFRILGNAIELRHAPFMLWINDLSAPDRLFRFPFEIPFMSPPYGIPILTLLMGASMFIQQKMTPTPGDPTQAKVMMFLPLIFTVMFINFPSGLVLYWLVNNILSIGQQYRINRKK